MKKNHRCSDCGRYLPADHTSIEEMRETTYAEDSETAAQRKAEEAAGVESYHRNHNPLGVGRKAPHRQY